MINSVARLMLFFFLFLIITTPASAVERSQIIGHWQHTENNKTGDMYFYDDGTYAGTIFVAGKPIWDFAGKWGLHNDELNYEYTKSSTDWVTIGQKDHDKILKITHDYYVILTVDGKERKYTKLQ